MKKLLLIPIIATSLLTGCDFQSAPEVSLDKWLTDISEDTFTYFTLSDFGGREAERFSYNDYEYKVADIIKQNTSSLKLRKVKPDVKGAKFHYDISRNIGDYYSLSLLGYENCVFMLLAGKKDGKYFSKEYDYAISKKDSEAIINGMKDRLYEMEDLYNETNKKAEEDATLDKFYESVSNPENDVVVYYNDQKTSDSSLSLLEDIKNLDYQEKTSSYTPNGDEEMYYGVDEDYMIKLNGNGSLVFYRFFRNPANPFYRDSLWQVTHNYNVSKDKAQALIEKAKALYR